MTWRNYLQACAHMFTLQINDLLGTSLHHCHIMCCTKPLNTFVTGLALAMCYCICFLYLTNQIADAANALHQVANPGNNAPVVSAAANPAAAAPANQVLALHGDDGVNDPDDDDDDWQDDNEAPVVALNNGTVNSTSERLLKSVRCIEGFV